MTDKQIIDVCPYQGECSVSGCKRNDDGCFVRQLFEERYIAEQRIVELNKTIKSKEQECEELKENLPNAITRLMGELDQLKAELTRANCQIADDEILQCDMREAIEELKAENEKLDTENKRLVGELANPVFDSFEELDKLKQTLTEIKEIAEHFYNTGFVRTDTGSILINNNTCINAIEQILQKISEVEYE